VPELASVPPRDGGASLLAADVEQDRRVGAGSQGDVVEFLQRVPGERHVPKRLLVPRSEVGQQARSTVALQAERAPLPALASLPIWTKLSSQTGSCGHCCFAAEAVISRGRTRRLLPDKLDSASDAAALLLCRRAAVSRDGWLWRVSPAHCCAAAPLRTGLAAFTASGSSEPRTVRWRDVVRSARWSVSSAGPFTTTIVVVSNLSVGSGVIVIFAFWAHLTASARSRAPGTRPGIRPVIRDDQLEDWPCSRSFPSPFGTRIRFSVILFPPGSWALLTVGLPDQGRTRAGLPRSARTSCDRGGCPLYPEDGGALPGLRDVLSRRLPLYHG
jgi:hypothetical protein